MLKPGRLFLAAALCILTTACGSETVTIVAPAGSAGYAGQWSGTTSQGRPITFTVSSDQKVTAITVGYNFGSCSGVKTFENLKQDIGVPPLSATPNPSPGFGYGSGNPEEPNYTQIYGSFGSSTTATGSVIFGAFTGCGNSGGIWSASKR